MTSASAISAHGRRRLPPSTNAGESRNVILTDAEVAGVVAAAYAIGPEFGLLVEICAVTGARIGQLARLTVEEVQDGPAPRLMVPPSRKGKNRKAVARRPVPIPVSLSAKLKAAGNGRSPDATLLLKSDGRCWRKNDHSRSFARAAKAAGLDPETVTLYALRHSSIVRELLANVPIRIVATKHDTSVTMIEKTYSKYIADFADALSRKALLDLGAPAGDNVVPMGARQ
jgi:integrase